jgi:hypothetical protein
MSQLKGSNSATKISSGAEIATRFRNLFSTPLTCRRNEAVVGIAKKSFGSSQSIFRALEFAAAQFEGQFLYMIPNQKLIVS